jgi:thioredoxin-related protein
VWVQVPPWIYATNNKETNIVASCHICNQLKKDMVFNNDDEARNYIQNKRTKAGFRNYW